MDNDHSNELMQRMQPSNRPQGIEIIEKIGIQRRIIRKSGNSPKWGNRAAAKEKVIYQANQ